MRNPKEADGRPHPAGRFARWKARRAARRAARRSITIVPPEGVPVPLDLATIGSRFGAQTVDLIVTSVALVSVTWGLFYLLGPFSPLAVALMGLAFFATRTPYYVATEIAWNGRTLAKRWLGLRTVSMDATGLSVRQAVVRNLVREVEVFLPLTLLFAPGIADWQRAAAVVWVSVCFAVALRSRHRQRLGDMLAGTVVVRDPRPVLMPDLAGQGAASKDVPFVFSTAQLDHYGAHELGVLERLLRQVDAIGTATKMPDAYRRDVDSVARRIRGRIGFGDPVEAEERLPFLRAFYAAQRAHLEGRALLGDARSDRNWRQSEDGDGTNAPRPVS